MQHKPDKICTIEALGQALLVGRSIQRMQRTVCNNNHVHKDSLSLLDKDSKVLHTHQPVLLHLRTHLHMHTHSARPPHTVLHRLLLYVWQCQRLQQQRAREAAHKQHPLLVLALLLLWHRCPITKMWLQWTLATTTHGQHLHDHNRCLYGHLHMRTHTRDRCNNSCTRKHARRHFRLPFQLLLHSHTHTRTRMRLHKHALSLQVHQ